MSYALIMRIDTQLNNGSGKHTQKSTVSLADWVALPGKRVSANAAFVPVRDEVLRAITCGYDMRTIWHWLRDTGRFPGTYESFRRCVRRAQQDLRKGEQPAAALPAKPVPAGIGGFSLSQKSKEELT